VKVYANVVNTVVLCPWRYSYDETELLKASIWDEQLRIRARAESVMVEARLDDASALVVVAPPSPETM